MVPKDRDFGLQPGEHNNKNQNSNRVSRTTQKTQMAGKTITSPEQGPKAELGSFQ